LINFYPEHRGAEPREQAPRTCGLGVKDKEEGIKELMTYREFMLKYNNNSELRKWLLTRPAKIRRVVLKYPPDCYLNINNAGHYLLYSYDEELDNSITVKLEHGRDSFLPGVIVFGIPLESLIPCSCGKWEKPTDKQAADTGVMLDAERAKRKKE